MVNACHTQENHRVRSTALQYHSSAMSGMEQDLSPFLRLPAEIRLEIYSFFLPDPYWEHEQHECTRQPPNYEGCDCLRPCTLVDTSPIELACMPVVCLINQDGIRLGHANSRFECVTTEDGQTPRKALPKVLPLLLTCRLVYEEVLDALCTRTLFVVELRVKRELRYFPRAIPPRNYYWDWTGMETTDSQVPERLYVQFSKPYKHHQSGFLQRARYLDVTIRISSADDLAPVTNMLEFLAAQLNDQTTRTRVELLVTNMEKPKPSHRGMSALDKWNEFLRAMRSVKLRSEVELHTTVAWLREGSRYLSKLRMPVTTTFIGTRRMPFDFCYSHEIDCRRRIR
jgi:hypothetical protein